MTVSYTFTPDTGGQDRLLHSPSGPYGRWLTRVCNQVRTEAVQRANVDTGYLRSRIEYRVFVEGGKLVGEVAARTSYARFVHDGFGSYPGNPFLVDALRAVLGGSMSGGSDMVRYHTGRTVTRRQALSYGGSFSEL